MANPRIFVSFAIEDVDVKILFTGQAKNDKVPYDFVDMSVKKPWDSEWKTQCRSRIKGCDGVIVLITKNLKQGEGALWEIKCAKEEKVPILGVYMSGANSSHAPTELDGIKKVSWTWKEIGEFVNGL